MAALSQTPTRAEIPPDATSPMPGAALQLAGVSVRYGGVQAMQDVSLRLSPGRVYGLIGPNGAGKSTTINVIAGVTRPSTGRVHFNGRDVTDWPAYQRARAGLARTFQNLALFPSMTVRENIACGIAAMPDGEQAQSGHARVEQALDQLRLRSIQHQAVAVQSLALRKRVELARALVGRPALLLLDEPAAGLAASEIEELTAMVRSACQAGAAVLLVEHDMALVMRLCEHIFVLDFGRLIAEGTPAEVQGNPAVQAAYFGGGDDEL